MHQKAEPSARPPSAHTTTSTWLWPDGRISSRRDREELVAAARALDRVLLSNDYLIPQWTYSKVRTARWGQVRQARPDAYLRLVGVSDDLVVGHPARHRNGVSIVSGQLAIRCARARTSSRSAPIRVLERRSAANVACPTRTKGPDRGQHEELGKALAR